MTEKPRTEDYYLEHLQCNRCRVPLSKQQADFGYLERAFHAQVFRCPECGQIFIPEDLVKGRMAEVERELEDK